MRTSLGGLSLQGTELSKPQVTPLIGCPGELLGRYEGPCFMNYAVSLAGDEVPYGIWVLVGACCLS